MAKVILIVTGWVIVTAGVVTGVLVFNAFAGQPDGERFLYAGVSGFCFGIAGVFALGFAKLID